MIADRVHETTTTTGTGTVDLLGAEDGKQSFVDAFGTGAKLFYVIALGTEYEVGIGTITAGTPDQLSRDTVIQSSNSDSLVNFSAGTKAVFCDLPAQMWAFPDTVGDITTSGQLDNLNPGARGAFRLTQATMLTGISGGARGKMHLVVNANSVALTIADSNTNSTAANRIVTPIGDDVLVPAGGIALFWYDVTASRWRCVAVPDPTIATFGTDITTSGSLDNVDIGTAGAIRFTQATHISGIAGGVHGRVLIVHNASASNLVLQDSDTSSSAANRLALPADIVLPADGMAILQYDGTAQRWRTSTQDLRRKSISFTRDLSTASGNVAYTGVGFRPSAIIFLAVRNTGAVYISSGFDEGGSVAVINGSSSFSATALFIGADTGTNFQTATVASYDSDGFTLAWTKTNSPTGTYQIYALCLR